MKGDLLRTLARSSSSIALFVAPGVAAAQTTDTATNAQPTGQDRSVTAPKSPSPASVPR